MWSVENRTAYAADGNWFRDVEGAEVWAVAVKATYDIRADGSTCRAQDQVPIYSGPVPHVGAKSPRYDTDLGPAKAATDVILCGHAHSQTGRPVTEMLVAFRVGPIKRGVRVVGERAWERSLLGMSPGKPQPYLRMPLIFERAYGGDDPVARQPSRNPVGCGANGGSDAERIANLEPIDHPLRRRGERIAPVAFSPIPAHWPSRARYAGTYDQAWMESRRPLPPEDLDARFWQIAPEEQQVPGRLRGGETVTLVNLTPAGFAPDGRVAFFLPKLSLDFETRFFDGSRERMRSAIHTVILEPDFPRLSIVHHATLACHGKVNLLDRTVVREKARPLDRPGVPDADAREELLP